MKRIMQSSPHKFGESFAMLLAEGMLFFVTWMLLYIRDAFGFVVLFLYVGLMEYYIPCLIAALICYVLRINRVMVLSPLYRFTGLIACFGAISIVPGYNYISFESEPVSLFVCCVVMAVQQAVYLMVKRAGYTMEVTDNKLGSVKGDVLAPLFVKNFIFYVFLFFVLIGYSDAFDGIGRMTNYHTDPFITYLSAQSIVLWLIVVLAYYTGLNRSAIYSIKIQMTMAGVYMISGMITLVIFDSRILQLIPLVLSVVYLAIQNKVSKKQIRVLPPPVDIHER